MKAVKTVLKQMLGQMLSLFHNHNTIVFESTPDFADNTYAVFCEMMGRGLDKRYKMVWSCTQRRKLPEELASIRCIYPKDKNIWQKLRNAYYMASAKCLISCNRYLIPWRKQQKTFFLGHGTPMKSVHNYYNLPASINYCLSAAKGVEEMTAYEFCAPPEKMFSLGLPRNDILTAPALPVKELLGTDCKKVAVWYPTFRTHRNGMQAGSGKALPIIHDAEAAAQLNDWARQMDVLLVLKPHFAQDLTKIKALELSNIRFIDDSFFRENGITSYGFVARCDALITDYSSIYYDYMLCDKPIGLVWEDVEEYRKNPGFAVDIDAYGAGGVKIYDLEDFKSFIRELAEDVDSCADARRSLRDLTNYAPDGQNTARVTDFILGKI